MKHTKHITIMATNMKHTTPLILALLAALTACQPDAGHESRRPDDGTVVTLGVSLAGAPTRGAYTLTTPTTEHPLAAEVWGSTVSHSYPNQGKSGSDGTVANHIGVTFRGSAVQLNKSEIQNVGSTPIYFIGLSPTGWTDPATPPYGRARFTFNGSHDVLFAPQVQGGGGGFPLLSMHHLLCHLRFVFLCEGATDEEREAVAYAWGRIKHIKLVSPAENTVELDFSTVDNSSETDAATLADAVASACTFSGDAGLPLYKTGTAAEPFAQTPGQADNSSLWYALPTTAAGEEAAYVLCRPVEATSAAGANEYQLVIDTERRRGVTVLIDLRDAGGSLYSGTTRASAFTVTLRFRFARVAAVATSLADWYTDGGLTQEEITD